MELESFRWPDILVFVIVLVISLAIGIYHACTGEKQRTLTEYFHGNRNLQFLAIGISILVSYMSSVTLLGQPAEIYTKGIAFILYIGGSILGKVTTAFVVVPLLYPLKLTSSYEYLGRRFQSKMVRTIGSLLNIMSMLLYPGVVIYGTATAIEAVADIPAWVSITVIGILATFYTSVGGMRAVVWTDVFQSVIIVAGVLAILIKGIIIQGGPSRIWHQSYDGGRLALDRIWSFDPRERYTVWGLIIGAATLTLGSIGVSQANVQRFSSVSTLRKAKLSVLTSLPGFIVVFLAASYIGLILYSYFLDKGCDPLASGTAKNPNQLIVLFVTEVFEFMPGFTGLFLAAVSCATLSTVSSLLNALSALTWEDFCKVKCSKRSMKCQSIIVKCFVGFYGIGMTAVAFLAMSMGGTVIQLVLTFWGAVAGPLLGMFVLGAFSAKTNWIGASVGAVVALCFTIWLGACGRTLSPLPTLPPGPTTSCNTSLTSQPINGTFIDSGYIIVNSTTTGTPVLPDSSVLEPLYRISYLWYALIGMLTTVVIGVVISILTGSRTKEDIPAELLIFPVEKISSVLPASLRKLFNCGTSSSASHDGGNCQENYDGEEETGPEHALQLLPSPGPNQSL